MSIIINYSGSKPFSTAISTDPSQAFAAGGPSGFEKEAPASAVAKTQVEWNETPEAFVFKANLPGLKIEEVKTKWEEDQRILQISGEHISKEEPMNDNWHSIDSLEKFFQRFPLPMTAKVEEMTKTVDSDGVLTVTVPKQPDLWLTFH